MIRRSFLAGSLALIAAPALAEPAWQGPRYAGASEAPSTIGMYFSLTCPHCSAFAINTWPEVQSKLIATGKLRWQWLDCPLDDLAVAAEAAVRMLPITTYTESVIALLADRSWISDGVSGLRQRMIRLHLPSEATDAGIDSPTIKAWLISQRRAAARAGVPGTPTFSINDKLSSGELEYQAIFALAKPQVGSGG